MNFMEFLFSFFPHRWLNTDDKSNRRFFGGLGAILEYVEDLISSVKKETKIGTATYSIPNREEELGIIMALNKSDSTYKVTKLNLDGSWSLDGSKALIGTYSEVSKNNNSNNFDYKIKELPVDLRRTRLLTYKRRTDSPITKSELIEALKTYGADVEIKNIPSNYEIIIRIKNHESVSNHTFFEITRFVEYVCRAHVGKVWAFPMSISVMNKPSIITKTINRLGVKTIESKGYKTKHRITNTNLIPPSTDVNITIKQNYWTLDGTYILDGSRSLNAEIRKEVV